MKIASAEEVYQFWFINHDEDDWFFNKTDAFDQKIRDFSKYMGGWASKITLSLAEKLTRSYGRDYGA